MNSASEGLKPGLIFPVSQRSDFLHKLKILEVLKTYAVNAGYCEVLYLRFSLFTCTGKYFVFD